MDIGTGSIGMIDATKGSFAWVDCGCWIFCVEPAMPAPFSVAYLFSVSPQVGPSLYVSRMCQGERERLGKKSGNGPPWQERSGDWRVSSPRACDNVPALLCHGWFSPEDGRVGGVPRDRAFDEHGASGEAFPLTGEISTTIRCFADVRFIASIVDSPRKGNQDIRKEGITRNFYTLFPAV